MNHTIQDEIPQLVEALRSGRKNVHARFPVWKLEEGRKYGPGYTCMALALVAVIERIKGRGTTWRVLFSDTQRIWEAFIVDNEEDGDKFPIVYVRSSRDQCVTVSAYYIADHMRGESVNEFRITSKKSNEDIFTSFCFSGKGFERKFDKDDSIFKVNHFIVEMAGYLAERHNVGKILEELLLKPKSLDFVRRCDSLFASKPEAEVIEIEDAPVASAAPQSGVVKDTRCYDSD